MKKLEALADAIVSLSGYRNPESSVYQARNPGALKAFSPKHPRTIEGLRIFNSHLDGYQALLYDLEIKCSGQSHTRLKGASTLRDLVLARGEPETTAQYIVKYLRRALNDREINVTTPLSTFLE